MRVDPKGVISWLLSSGEPWVRYNTLVDLVGAGPSDPEARSAYRALQDHPRTAALIEALDPWPQPQPLKRAYDPKDSLWKLQTLADFGLRRDDERIAALAERVFAAQAEDGGFLHGGFDHTHSWDARPYICIAHVMTYALARFGYARLTQDGSPDGDPRLERAYDQLLAWQRLDGGWHPNRLNLPGEKGETEPSCPFGTQNVLRALSAHPILRESKAAQRGAGYLLECWKRRAEPHRPVGFGIGSDWGKVTYPFVQYGLLKTVDTLAQLPALAGESRFRELVGVLESKRGEDGLWRAESASKAWSEFDFGQKKAPSPWITFLAERAIARAGQSDFSSQGLNWRQAL